jgi:hypothetical protein
MSKSAGTLVTTHNATYVHPRFMPGYQGHVPTMKFDYGETYGNQTAKYFQDYRSQTLESSKSNYSHGGYFPAFYSYSGNLAVEARTRKWDRWLESPHYRLTNIDHNRREGLINFNKLTEAHRDHYNDKSQTVQRVNYFTAAVPDPQTS